MKTISKLFNNRLVLRIALAITLVAHLISWGFRYDLSKSDWGTWVGSIGTVATLAMTVWLATADRRRAQREAHDRAVVAAASISKRLETLQKTLQTAVEIFLDYSTERTVGEYLANAGAIEGAGTWTDEELLPLIVLPHHISARLAGTRPLLQKIVVDMRDVAQNYSYSWYQESLEKKRGEIAANLVMCRDTVHLAAEECKRTVRAALRTQPG